MACDTQACACDVSAALRRLAAFAGSVGGGLRCLLASVCFTPLHSPASSALDCGVNVYVCRASSSLPCRCNSCVVSQQQLDPSNRLLDTAAHTLAWLWRAAAAARGPCNVRSNETNRQSPSRSRHVLFCPVGSRRSAFRICAVHGLSASRPLGVGRIVVCAGEQPVVGVTCRATCARLLPWAVKQPWDHQRLLGAAGFKAFCLT
jgi:hypothetical protein